MRISALMGTGARARQPLKDFFSSSQRDEVSLAGVESEGRPRYPICQYPTPCLRHQCVSGSLIDMDWRRHILGSESPWSNDGQVFVDNAVRICCTLTQDGGQPPTQLANRIGFGTGLSV